MLNYVPLKLVTFDPGGRQRRMVRVPHCQTWVGRYSVTVAIPESEDWQPILENLKSRLVGQLKPLGEAIFGKCIAI